MTSTKESKERELKHHLEVANPMFSFFIKNMDKDTLAKWIQFQRVSEVGGRVVFFFKSSLNSLSFQIETGTTIIDIEYFKGKGGEIFQYFRTLKYKCLFGDKQSKK